MKHLLVIELAIVAYSCAPDRSKNKGEEYPDQSYVKTTVKEVITNPTKGIGDVKNIRLKTPIEQERVGRGLAIYEMKCSACHKLTDQRLVGPGWKEVTKRRAPEWIMNMATNVDVMLEKDPEAQKMLELCL